MSEKIIQMQDVNKWFDDFHVLKDINLDVESKQKIVENRVFCLLLLLLRVLRCREFLRTYGKIAKSRVFTRYN